MISVLPDHIGVEAAAVQAGDVTEGVLQPGGIQQGARAQHLAPGQAGQVGDLTGDQIAGIGDIHEDAVKVTSIMDGMILATWGAHCFSVRHPG